jgi:hypothetical protein
MVLGFQAMCASDLLVVKQVELDMLLLQIDGLAFS